VLMFFWRKTGLRFRPDFRWRGVGLGTTGRAAGWIFGMILTTQLAGIVQSQVATLADRDDGSIRMLSVAWLIFMLPHSIIAVSIATPYFTRMSGHARDGKRDAVRTDLSSSLRLVGLMMFGAAVALAAAAVPFAALFGRTDREISGMALVLVAYLVGLIPFSTLFLLQRTFYALGDTRTPFFVQLVQSSLFVIGALLVAFLAPSPVIAISLAAVTSLAGVVQALIAAGLLRGRLGGIDARAVLRRFGLYAVATIPAAAVGLGVFWWLASAIGGFVDAGYLYPMLSVGLIGALTLLVYVGVLALFRLPELTTLASPVLRMLRRR